MDGVAVVGGGGGSSGPDLMTLALAAAAVMLIVVAIFIAMEADTSPASPSSSSSSSSSPAPPSGPVDCVVSDWSFWGQCLPACGTSEEAPGQRSRTRRRVVTRPPSGGGAECPTPLEESEPCGDPCEPVDCVLGPWSDWSACSPPCPAGGGEPEQPRTQTRTRSVVTPATDGGASCEGEALTETRPCEEPACSTLPVDCVMSGWSNWSACSEVCGGGTQQRFRQQQVAAQNGGMTCREVAAADAPSAVWIDAIRQTQERECNTEPCCDPYYAWVYPDSWSWVETGDGMCVQEKRAVKVFEDPPEGKDPTKATCPAEPAAIRLDPKACDAPGVPNADLCAQQLVDAARSKGAHIPCTSGRHKPSCDTNDLDRETIMTAFASGPPSSSATNCTDSQLLAFATEGVVPGSSLRPEPADSGTGLPSEPRCYTIYREGYNPTSYIIRTSADGQRTECLRHSVGDSTCKSVLCGGGFDPEEVNLAYLERAKTDGTLYIWADNVRVHPLDDAAWIDWTRSWFVNAYVFGAGASAGAPPKRRSGFLAGHALRSGGGRIPRDSDFYAGLFTMTT